MDVTARARGAHGPRFTAHGHAPRVVLRVRGVGRVRLHNRARSRSSPVRRPRTLCSADPLYGFTSLPPRGRAPEHGEGWREEQEARRAPPARESLARRPGCHVECFPWVRPRCALFLRRRGSEASTRTATTTSLPHLGFTRRRHSVHVTECRHRETDHMQCKMRYG